MILVFLVTAWLGYWAAYDSDVAWNKAWLIVTAVLLYYCLREQPKENLIWVSVILFCLGVGVSFYYFLTYDFISAPRRIDVVNNIGRWFMKIRPQTGWTSIHPNYVAGVVAVTMPFIFFPFLKFKEGNVHPPVLFYVFAATGLSATGLALVMATSRGVAMAILSGAGVWLLWRLIHLSGIKRRIQSRAVFPFLVLIYLLTVIATLYIGPAKSGSVFTDTYFYGTGSRAELFGRSMYLVLDYPIVGGGLGAFPGLYSQYLLNIPFFNVVNSHNLFLDVAIEQGLLGGLSLAILYVASLWVAADSIANRNSDRAFGWIVLFSLAVAIIHGMVDDYLYNGIGSILSLFLVGLAFNGNQVNKFVVRRLDFRTAGAIFLIWAAIVMVNLNLLRSIWYANLGAIQQAKVELKSFPDAGWAGYNIVSQLDEASSTLQMSLQFDPENRTANQRLGMIAMLRHEFESAVVFLEVAHLQAPGHRGIIKSLGYSYAWLGDLGNAELFLSQTPEAKEELDVYIWWWDAQGRKDLSEKASLILDVLNEASP
ncbi:MAG TPA: hypothetical protein DCX53_09580 [Anaerolineae bacterium]|nr:hypothetical protein [Anaerolineae bacterium]